MKNILINFLKRIFGKKCDELPESSNVINKEKNYELNKIQDFSNTLRNQTYLRQVDGNGLGYIDLNNIGDIK